MSKSKQYVTIGAVVSANAKLVARPQGGVVVRAESGGHRAPPPPSRGDLAKAGERALLALNSR